MPNVSSNRSQRPLDQHVGPEIAGQRAGAAAGDGGDLLERGTDGGDDRVDADSVAVIAVLDDMGVLRVRIGVTVAA